MNTPADAPVGNPHAQWPWRRIVAPLLLITLALIMLAMHAAHTAESGTTMQSAPGHVTAMHPTVTDTMVDNGPMVGDTAVLAAGISNTPLGGMSCGMADCPDGSGGTMTLLCLAMLPGLALIALVVLRRPQAAGLPLRRRRIGAPAPADVPWPAAAVPLQLRLCVLRT